MEAVIQFQPEHYRSYLRILAQVYLRNAGQLQRKIDASDVVQDALLQALLALPQFHGNTEDEFVAWLRAILANKLTDHVRHFLRKKRDAGREQALCDSLRESSVRLEKIIAADQTSPSQHVLRKERLRLLAEALDGLPDSQRTAIELHLLSGYSLKETANKMARTDISVAGLVRRGLKTLRENLKGQERDLL